MFAFESKHVVLFLPPDVHGLSNREYLKNQSINDTHKVLFHVTLLPDLVLFKEIDISDPVYSQFFVLTSSLLL